MSFKLKSLGHVIVMRTKSSTANVMTSEKLFNIKLIGAFMKLNSS